MSISIATNFKNNILDFLWNKKITATIYKEGQTSAIAAVGNIYFPTKASNGGITLQPVDFLVPSVQAGQTTKVVKVELYYEDGTTGGKQLLSVLLNENEQAEYGPDGGIFRIGELKLSL